MVKNRTNGKNSSPDNTFDEGDNNVDENDLVPTKIGSHLTSPKTSEKRIPASRFHTAKFSSISMTSNDKMNCMQCQEIKSFVKKEFKRLSDDMAYWKTKLEADMKTRVDGLVEKLFGYDKTIGIQE